MMKNQIRSLTARMFAVTIVATLVAGTAPAMASALQDASVDPIQAKFTSALAPLPSPVVKVGRVIVEAPAQSEAPIQAAVAQTSAPTEVSEPSPVANEPGEAALTTPIQRAQAVVPAPVTVPDKATGTTTGSTAVKTTPTSGDELAQAKAILSGLIARYPILAGTTVSIGTTPGGYQAVAYYQSGRIVISPTHTASLTTILNHEIGHIIDWRDNGQIDWGENFPPNYGL